jgi:predicted  nucleic acid-binding Zn-ribbon protein
MQNQIHYLAALSYVDQKLDELSEEFGDLPDKVKASKRTVDELKAIVEETESILNNVRQFTSNSKVTLQELREKEEQLSKQQFLVRNNKEFDAITKEIEHVRHEHTRLIDELRTVGIKEENPNNAAHRQGIRY